MGFKEQRQIAQEKSFVYKLTKADITKLLEKLGLSLAYLYDQIGDAVPPIRRNYDKESKKYVITINYRKNLTSAEKDIEQAVYRNFHPLFAGVLNGYMSSMNTGVLLLTDYKIIALGQLNTDALAYQKEYAYFMYEKFGEYYKQKYNSVVRKEIKESKKQKQLYNEK